MDSTASFDRRFRDEPRRVVQLALEVGALLLRLRQALLQRGALAAHGEHHATHLGVGAGDGGVARAPADKLEVVFANLCDGMSAEEIKRLTGAAAGGKKDMSFPQFMTLFDTAAVEDDRGT